MSYASTLFSPSRRRWLLGAAALPWAPAALAAEAAPPGAERREWPRQRATPAVELPSLDGTPWRLAADKGRPILLNFWATWCEPCRAEMPALQQLARDQRVQVMAVNYREGEAAVRRFLEKTGLDLPVLLDREGAAAKSFDVRIFPSTVGIDRRGRAKFVVTGEFDWSAPLAARWLAEL